ncbi:putative RNA-directed DNA polymerase [Tanacetum coccineum]
MAMILAFTTVDKTAHNSRKFAFTLSPTNYGYWKTMIEPFLITNNLMSNVDGSIPCPSKTLSVTDGATVLKKNPSYPIWVSNDAHVRMLSNSTISEASFRHVQGTTSHDLWLSLKKAYAPHSTSREYTLKTQLLRIKMHDDETPDAYLNRAQEYADALATIGEPVKDKDLVMLVISGLREEYNGLKTTITARQSPTAFSELHALLSNNKGTIDNIICQLGSAFALKDLGPLNYFLGIEIVPHVSGILLSQKKYILELLQSAGLSNCNPVSSPMVTSSSLSLDDSTAFSNPVKYRQVVGSLQYVTLSRPDIAFAVNKVCQYMHAPTENHWSAVKRILRYLHGTVEHGMLIRRSSGSTLQAFTDVLWKGNPDTSLEAFSDADWAGDSDDRRSTGGFAIYLGSNLISWTARKQRTVSRSSTEAEYKALADTVAELTWLQALLNELGIRSSSTPILWCDNLGATYLSANPIFHARTKHVEIDYHFVREKIAQGDLRVQHISTHDQIADIFTKPLPTPRFLFLRSKLQVVARP